MQTNFKESKNCSTHFDGKVSSICKKMAHFQYIRHQVNISHLPKWNDFDWTLCNRLDILCEQEQGRTQRKRRCFNINLILHTKKQRPMMITTTDGDYILLCKTFNICQTDYPNRFNCSSTAFTQSQRERKREQERDTYNFSQLLEVHHRSLHTYLCVGG